MAEAVGLVTGLASLAISITEGVAKLRDLYKESKTNSQEIESLMRDLEFLTLSVKGVEGLSTLDDQNLSVLIDHCRTDVQDVASSLQDMTDTLDASEKRPRKALSRMKWLSSNKKSLEKLKGLTETARSKIALVFLYSHPMSTPALPVMLPHSTTQQAIITGKDQEQSEHVDSAKMIAQQTATSERRVVRPHRPRQRRVDCTRRACWCTCHIKAQMTSRFWKFEYTPLSFILNGCSNPNCTASEYVSEVRIALTQLGWHRAITFGWRLNFAAGAYSIRPLLEIKEEVVRYTSRGFELLLRLNKGLSDWREVVQEFREMFQKDNRIIRHVNPGGRGYIGELLWWSSSFADWGSVLNVLEVFMSEFKMTVGLDDINFLYRMAHMIGEGPHLSIFEELLALHFDPCNLPTPAAEKWPQPCNPNWQSEHLTRDPFFLELLAMMVSVDPDFGGTSPLQHEILCGSADSVAELLDRGTCNDESNFLGQKALHLAVFNPECAHVLISAGYSINVTDKNGTTPLMYACAMGNADVARLLISKGAEVGLIDRLRHRDFIGYALARSHYKLIVDLALYYQGNFPEDAGFVGALFARRIALSMCSPRTTYYWDDSFCFEDLLLLTSKLDFTFTDSHKETKDNNIMHYSVGLTNAKALIAHGFTGLDQRNSYGVTPIMKCIPNYPETMDILIENGVDVSAQDLSGRAPMHYAVNKWWSSNAYSTHDTSMHHNRCIESLLRAGASPESRDFCRCPCSPEGCMPAIVLAACFCHPYETLFSQSIRKTVEWLCILEERKVMEIVKSQLISFIRRARFDEMELTHTCCSGDGRGHWGRWNDFMIRSSHLSSEDKATVMREQRDRIRHLESQISLLKTKSYTELRGAWLQQLRQSHNHYLKRNNFPVWEEVLRNFTVPKRIISQRVDNTWQRYSINFQKDIFEVPEIGSDSDSENHDDRDGPIIQMGKLLWALEKDFTSRRNANEDITELQKWYDRRFAWMTEILDCMDISKDLIVAQFRERGLDTWEKDGHLLDSLIEHFLQGCEQMDSASANGEME